MLTPISTLLTTHSHYDFYRSTWLTIKDLREGYPTIYAKKERYAPQRIGEEPEVYANRLSALSYTNILNENIHRLASILTSSPMTLEYQDTLFWDEVTRHMDGAKMSHQAFIYRVYTDLLYYGKVTIGVDNPVITSTARSRLEYNSAKQYPRVTVFNPLEVINWGDNWVMTLQIDEVNQPLQPNRIIATWKLWTEETITTWSTQVLVDIDNVITQVMVGGKWHDPLSKKAMLEGSTIVHGWGMLPVTRYCLDDEQWVGMAVYPKALQHFNIESSWTWAGRYAGIIQRVFTPLAPTPNDNPALLIDPPDYSQLQSDNAHVLIGNGFQFVETSGSAIATLGAQLAAIKADVKDTVNITFASGAPVEQSGVAKKVDMLLLQNALTSYGYIGTEVAEGVLSHIATIANTDTPIVHSNLSYSLEDATAMLDTVDRLAPHAENVAPVTLREVYKKLQHLLLPDAPEEIQDEIDEETPTFNDEPQQPESESEDPRDLKTRLMDYYDMTPAEADSILQETQD